MGGKHVTSRPKRPYYYDTAKIIVALVDKVGWQKRRARSLRSRGNLSSLRSEFSSVGVGTQSCVCQALCQWVCLRVRHLSLDTTARETCMLCDRCKLQTSCLEFKRKAHKALHSCGRAEAFYVAHRWGQEQLNRVVCVNLREKSNEHV